MLIRLLKQIDRLLITSRPKSETKKAKITAYQLEERVMYSVSPLGDPALFDPALADAVDANELELESSAEHAGSESADGEGESAKLDPRQLALAGSEPHDPSIRREIYFIDQGVEDFHLLLDDLMSIDDPTLDIEVVFLTNDRDGVDQITSTLSVLTDLDAVHIVSHGAAGQVQLGGTILSNDNIAAYAGQIATWADALDVNADLLFYGCDLASGDGVTLVESIAELSGADVAASDDLTGHENLDADWILEHHVGEIETELAFSLSVQAAWHHSLDITTGLVGHYQFDTSGSTTDATGNQNATVSAGNATGETPAAVGDQAVGFAADAGGNNSYLEVADNAAQDFGTGDFTIAFWYNQNGNPSSDARLLGDFSGSGTGFAVRATSGGSLQLDFVGPSGSANSSITGTFDGTWQHVAITYDSASNTYRWHINGSAGNTGTYNGGSINTSNPFRMGAVDGSMGDFDGQLDDVRLYTRELTTGDVAELYAVGADITTGLFAHYEFEENGGATATDSTANNNDGSWFNAPSWSGSSAVGSYSMDFASDSGGSQAYVEVPDDASIDIDGDFAFSFWYNSSTAPTSSENILSQYSLGDGFFIYHTSGGNLQFLVDGSSTI
ncbi:MAG: DUF4347 domain-containing protein, partial [Planctomycetota bacterium]